MQNYKFKALTLEITRRCNKRCAHCLRGEAQNLTMSKEIIDRIFDGVDDVEKIFLMSGEVLLEIDTIAYLIQGINNSAWSTRLIEFTTNGTICDKRIIDIMETFCLRNNGTVVLIRVSNDQFHNPQEFNKAYSFYSELIQEANKRIKSKHESSEIFIELTKEDAKIEHLRYQGNAEKLIDDGKEYKHGLYSTKYPEKYGHRLKIINGTIPCALQICANGNVSYCEELSYNSLDEISFGNILQDNLTNIINKHNDTCMVLCSETDRLRNADYGKYYADWGNSIVPLSFKLRKILYDKIIELRQLAKRKYPDVPAAEIITKIQFPNQFEEIFIYKRLHNSCQCASYGGKLAFTITEDNPSYAEVMNLLFMELLYGLKHEPGRKRPYHLFGDEADKVRWLREKGFGELQLRYMLIPSKIDNSKNFYCTETDDHFINYESDTSELSETDFDKLIASLRGENSIDANSITQKLYEENGLTLEELKNTLQNLSDEFESKNRKFEDFINRCKIR